MKLRDLALELSYSYGDTLAEALTGVTTYAAQLDVPGASEGGWQAPSIEVDDQTADNIRQAYHAGDAITKSDGVAALAPPTGRIGCGNVEDDDTETLIFADESEYGDG